MHDVRFKAFGMSLVHADSIGFYTQIIAGMAGSEAVVAD